MVLIVGFNKFFYFDRNLKLLGVVLKLLSLNTLLKILVLFVAFFHDLSLYAALGKQFDQLLSYIGPITRNTQ